MSERGNEGGSGVSSLIMMRSIFSREYRNSLMYILDGVRFSYIKEVRLSFDFFDGGPHSYCCNSYHCVKEGKYGYKTSVSYAPFLQKHPSREPIGQVSKPICVGSSYRMGA